MQLIEHKQDKRHTKNDNKKMSIANVVAIASCSLIGQSPQVNAEESLLEDWKLDAALMYYGEQDRVQALEGITNVQKSFGDNSLLDMKLVWDVLTGASASGAVTQNTSQTFTRPSGSGEYTIAAGDTPLDDTFQDTRVQLSANWTETLSNKWKINAGLYGSKEYDYTSIGINGGIEKSFNKDNTSIALSGAYSHDIWDPVGAIPVALSTMAIRSDFQSENDFLAAFAQTRDEESDTKDTFDVLLGMTQLISQKWLMQANYGLSRVSGYLTDPYKILSVVNNSGDAQRYIYENRPDSRLKHSVFLLGKGAFDDGVMDFSYRFNTDDWGISSHTLESHYRYYFNADFYGQLHLRYYIQNAADFYQPFLLDASPLPNYASADYRIADMTAYTLGVKLGYRFSIGHEMTYRLEYYQQDPDNNDTELVGQLQSHDLFPSVKSVIFQVGYAF